MIDKFIGSGLIVIASLLFAYGEVEERVNTGALLEPKGVILHGAGQAGITGFDAFENYWRIAPEGKKPMLFMDYFDTYHIKEHWSKELKEELLKYHRKGFYVIPQIGLNINYFYKDIIAGAHEKELDNLIKGFQYLGIPCYFRIGYEFNNQKPWSQEDFIAAYTIIVQKLRKANLEVANVWNCGLSGGSPSGYYPGDSICDWIGYNTFSDISGGQHCIILEMNDLAAAHSKPIMIGEASPSSVNDPNLSKRWEWYGFYFNMVSGTPAIKQTTYINWDWDVQDMIGGNIGFPWGDARLENEGSVKDQFFEQLSDPKYFHASSEKKFRALLGYDDNQAPETVKNLKQDGDFLVWDEVNDNGAAGLAHYTIYKNDTFWDYIIGTKYPVKDLYLGKDIKVHVTAMDRAGNESGKSNAYTVSQVNKIELIVDGGFDEPLTSLGLDWTFRGANDGGALPVDEFQHDTTSKLTGKYCAHLEWKKEVLNAKDWKLQFLQAINVDKDREYPISFKAVAKEPITAKLYFMSHHINFGSTHFPAGTDYNFETEWNVYNSWDVEIGTDAKEFVFKGKPNKTELGRLAFCFGLCPPTEVWLDDISVIAQMPSNIRGDNIIPGNLANRLNLRVVSNSNRGVTNIAYSLPRKSDVSINVYNCVGKRVHSVSFEKQPQGMQKHCMRTAQLTSGYYIVQLKTDGSVATQKHILAR